MTSRSSAHRYLIRRHIRVSGDCRLERYCWQFLSDVHPRPHGWHAGQNKEKKMANITAYASKAMLDWILGGATPTRPTDRYAALVYGTPNFTGGGLGTEYSSNQGYSRATALFSAAASPQTSASNTAGMTFGPFSSSS